MLVHPGSGSALVVYDPNVERLVGELFPSAARRTTVDAVLGHRGCIAVCASRVAEQDWMRLRAHQYPADLTLHRVTAEAKPELHDVGWESLLRCVSSTPQPSHQPRVIVAESLALPLSRLGLLLDVDIVIEVEPGETPAVWLAELHRRLKWGARRSLLIVPHPVRVEEITHAFAERCALDLLTGYGEPRELAGWASHVTFRAFPR